MSSEIKAIIGENIRALRKKKFPGCGGGKRCAAAFGVSHQQWSPWECGKRKPTELRMSEIASFFDVTVSWLHEDHRENKDDENVRGVFCTFPDQESMDSLTWVIETSREIAEATLALCYDQKKVRPWILAHFVIENLKKRNAFGG